MKTTDLCRRIATYGLLLAGCVIGCAVDQYSADLIRPPADPYQFRAPDHWEQLPVPAADDLQSPPKPISTKDRDENHT